MSISPQIIKQMIAADHQVRLQSFSDSHVQDIFRYGGMVGQSIAVYPRAERCMDLARQAILQAEEQGDSFCSGSIIAARELTGRKGRFQREWYAPEGGVWLAMTLVNTLLPDYAALLPMAAGVACCETVRHYQVPAQIKWVNDVHVNGVKIAGILAESLVGPRSGEEYILLGIGLNVNNRQFPVPLHGKACGLASFLDEPILVDQVMAQLVAKLAWNVGLLHFEEQRALDADLAEVVPENMLLNSWRNLSDTIGRRVQYGFNVVSQPQYVATVIGVDKSGSLEMELDDGSKVCESGGEIVYI